MPVVTCHEQHGAIATIKKWLGALKITIFPHIMLFLAYFGGNSLEHQSLCYPGFAAQLQGTSYPRFVLYT